MPSEPPWEWVDGDTVRSVQYGVLYGVILGAALVIVVFTFISLFDPSGLFSVPFPLLTTPLLELLFLFFLAGLFALLLLPRRVPVIGRLGVSPIGVRVILPNGGHTYYWGEVSQIGPDWLDISSLGITSRRYKLTTAQIQRVVRFLQSR
jgi:hypothetical protein